MLSEEIALLLESSKGRGANLEGNVISCCFLGKNWVSVLYLNSSTLEDSFLRVAANFLLAFEFFTVFIKIANSCFLMILCSYYICSFLSYSAANLNYFMASKWVLKRIPTYTFSSRYSKALRRMRLSMRPLIVLQ